MEMDKWEHCIAEITTLRHDYDMVEIYGDVQEYEILHDYVVQTIRKYVLTVRAGLLNSKAPYPEMPCGQRHYKAYLDTMLRWIIVDILHN